MSDRKRSRRTSCALVSDGDAGRSMPTEISAALEDPVTKVLRATLSRVGLTIQPVPILWKRLNDSFLRIMFPVSGAEIREGAIVSVVLLYDLRHQRTLYAHPMHAGPDANPLLKHLDGPMAAPKAQEGADGDRATRRLLEHKRALWSRFCRERLTLGHEEAGFRWRKSYRWSLRRLYFCSRCSACRWGTPFFDGPDASAPPKDTRIRKRPPAPRLSRAHAAMVADVIDSPEWKIEAAYAERGAFEVFGWPRLIAELEDEHVQMIFPTDAGILQAGSLVALAVVFHRPSRRIRHAHCLCAGPEPEIVLMCGERALGLPGPRSSETGDGARGAYAAWRREAWTEFWLDELHHGLEGASTRWLADFWRALEQLFGGNQLNHCSMTQVPNKGALE